MVAHPFRTATDTVDSNVTDGGITETLYDALQKRTAVVFGPTESLGDFSFDAGSVPLAVIYSATGYVYFYDASDSTTVDDGVTCLVTGDGRRYKLADASAIAISSVLAIDNDPPALPTDGDAYVVGTVPTGAWVGHANDIALRTPRGWVFAQPQVGAALLNQETGLNIQFSAAGEWGAMATALNAADVPPSALQFPGGVAVEAQQNAPPVSPSVGDHYLVGSTATGAWAGHENDIAYYTASAAWAFIAPYDGMSIFNQSADSTLTWFDASGDWRAPFPINWMCQGRLTLESGAPVSATDQVAKATLYFTPFRGNNIALYVNGGWALRSFTEKSLSLSGYTSGKPFDIFGYDNAGVLALESLVWTNDTARATGLAYQDGVLVKSGDTTRRYLGTIYTSATGQCEDRETKRYVWNYYNRVRRHLRVVDASVDSWTYSTEAWRQSRSDALKQLDFVQGFPEDEVEARLVVMSYSNSAFPFIGIGVDSVSPASDVVASFGTNTSVHSLNTVTYAGYPGIGRHTLKWLEYGGAGVTFYGDKGGTSARSGLIGFIQG